MFADTWAKIAGAAGCIIFGVILKLAVLAGLVYGSVLLVKHAWSD